MHLQLENGTTPTGGFLVIDRSGQIVATVDAYYVDRFSEGLAAFAEKKGWSPSSLDPNTPFGHQRGYIDKSGRIAIPAKFAYAGPFSEGLAAVAADGRCWVAGLFGEHDPAPSAPAQFTSCGVEAAPFVYEPCRHGYIDKTGRLQIPLRYELAQEFSEERAAVRLGGKWGFIDRNGDEIASFRFDEVRPFSEGRAAVRVGRKWGYIDRSGTSVIDARFDDALPFSNGLAAVKTGRRYFFIDSLNNEIIPGPFIQATQFVKGLAHVRLGEAKWAWIDSD